MIRTLTSAALAAATLATVGLAGTPAQATTADQAHMNRATKTCQAVTSEVQFEACSIGEFVLATKRVLLASEYVVDGDRIEVLAPSHKHLAPTKVTKVTKADAKAIKAANLVCQETESEVEFEACVVGEFVLNRGRYIGGDHYTTDFGRSPSQWVKLTKHSLRIA